VGDPGRLALIAQGLGPTADPAVVDDLVVRTPWCRRRWPTSTARSTVETRSICSMRWRRAPVPSDSSICLLRTGPYGDGFGPAPRGGPGVPPLTLDVLLERPHGVDLGRSSRACPMCCARRVGIELDAVPFLADLPRLVAALEAPVPEAVLVGRRDLRSNNSWMHNVEVLVKGRPRCTLHVHPGRCRPRWGVGDGDRCTVRAGWGRSRCAVEVTDAVRPGVVSLPHGWGHDLDGVRSGGSAPSPG
jgi:hypothetical protein